MGNVLEKGGGLRKGGDTCKTEKKIKGKLEEVWVVNWKERKREGNCLMCIIFHLSEHRILSFFIKVIILNNKTGLHNHTLKIFENNTIVHSGYTILKLYQSRKSRKCP